MPDDNYARDLAIATRDYLMALKVNPDTNPEPYVTRFPEDRQTEVRNVLGDIRQEYVEGEEIEELLLIWESPDFSLSDKLKATFKGLGEYLEKEPKQTKRKGRRRR